MENNSTSINPNEWTFGSKKLQEELTDGQALIDEEYISKHKNAFKVR